MIPLFQLQSQFSQALRYQTNSDLCHLVSYRMPSDARFQIYRNNFIISLSEILALTYPKTLALIGEEYFSTLARRHVLNNPLLSGDVSSYGKGFSETIIADSNLTSRVPYLADMARLEWEIDTSNQILNNPTPFPRLFSLDELANIPADEQEQIQLVFYPSVRLMHSGYSVCSIFQAIKTEQFDLHDLSSEEFVVIAALENDSVLVERLTEDEFALASRISEQATLGEINPDNLVSLAKLASLNLLAGFQLIRKL